MSGRIERGTGPSVPLNLENLRTHALPYLRRDFQYRCAYSMQHEVNCGGEHCMEVDYFDPRGKDESTQYYANLMFSSKHCNLAKLNFWPTDEELQFGLRLLNPTEEVDYGSHIFEDLRSNLLEATTPTGGLHIEICDLNADHLVVERRERTEFLKMYEKATRIHSEQGTPMPEELEGLIATALSLKIPPIASRP